MKYDSKLDTLKHIEKVREYLGIIFREIANRHTKHDASKLEEPEKSVFDCVTQRLSGLTYGSEEYKACLADMKPALDHHYANNGHHPECYGKKGMAGMTIVDLIEMLCDWAAATYRHDNGDIGESINLNMKRFGYDETLAHIFINTVQLYSMGQHSHQAYIFEARHGGERTGMKVRNGFKKWWRLSRFPQGRYDPWQCQEFENLARRAWQAALRSAKCTAKRRRG